MNPFSDVFISYGRADSREFARYLRDRLTTKSYTVWFDFNDIPQGVNYQNQIDDAIEKADNFLFIISPHAVHSPYCRIEIERAIALNKRLVPIMHVAEISRNTWQQRHPNGTDEDWATYKAEGKHSCFSKLHPEIAKINWNQISFREGLDDIERSFQALVELIERQRDYVHQHTVLLNQALEWERNQKQTQYLLIGEERQKSEQWLSVRFDYEQAPCTPTDLHCEFITESIKNANNLMTQVFLCHAESDHAVAGRVQRTLLRAGITTWTHRTDIEFGSDFQREMSRGVEEADNIIFVMTPDALDSDYCQKELAHAVALHKRIIPIQAKKVESEHVPPALRNLQYIDLTNNLIDADYQKDESALLRILKQDAAFYNEHKVLLTKALKWERQQHNPCVLLRGYELQHAEAWLKLAQQYPHHGAIALQCDFITESQRQPPGINLDVFISYSRTDSDFARKLNDGLQRQGKRTWFDQESIASGADFQQEIYRGIEASDHFLFILSPKAVASPYCADEVEYAAKLNKRIITVRHQSVEAETLHPELAKVQWIDFLANNRDFVANFKELIRTLDADPEHLRFHTRLLMQAIAWDEKGRRESLLLRGDELAEAEHWLLAASGKQPSPTELQGVYVGVSRNNASNRQRAVVGILGVLLGIAVFGAGFGFIQAREAKAKRQEAETAQIQLADALDVAQNRQRDAEAAKEEAEAAREEAEASEQAESEERQRAEDALQRAEAGEAAANRQSAIANVRELIARAVSQGNDDHISGIVMAIRAIGESQWTTGNVPETARRTLATFFKETFEINRLVGHTKSITEVVFSPDGNYIASSSEDRSVRIWDINGNLVAPPLIGHTDYVNAVAFSPDGRYVATASSDHTVRVWDWRNGQVIRTFTGHEDWVTSVAFSPNGQEVLSSGYDGMKLWDLQGHVTHPFPEVAGEIVKSAVFLPDGQTIVHTLERSVRFWHRLPDTWSLDNYQPGDLDSIAVKTVAITFDGQFVATTGYDNKMQLMTSAVFEANYRHWKHTWGSFESIRTVAPRLDQEYVAMVSDNNVYFRRQDYDMTRDVEEGSSRPQVFNDHQGKITTIAWHPGLANILVTGSSDTTVRLWDTTQLTHKLFSSGTGTVPTQQLLTFACHYLKAHPALLLDNIAGSGATASQTCLDYVWDDADDAHVLRLQGRQLAQHGDMSRAIANFEAANRLNPTLRINSQQEAQQFGAFQQADLNNALDGFLPEVDDHVTYGPITLSGFSFNGGINSIEVSPRETINGFTHFEYDCPGGCAPAGQTPINQIIIGIAGQEKAQACIYSDIGNYGSGSRRFQLTAPEDPGTYAVRFRHAQHYTCGEALGWWRVGGEPTSTANIGVVVVEE